MISSSSKNSNSNIVTACFALLLAFIGTSLGAGQTAILHLKSGDKVSGVIVSQNTNVVVISNAWVAALSVPVSEIASRDAGTNLQAGAITKPGSAPTNEPAATLPKTASPVVSGLASSHKAKPRGNWHGQINVGLDSLVSTKTQQDYYGKFSLTYLRPYNSNPKQFFRNTSQVSGQYQRTDGQESANRASGNNKTDFDFAKSYYGYSGFGAGFDEVRKIDFQFQAGPGVGRHLVRTDNTALDVESGIQYEAQYRRDAGDLESFFFRLAQDWDWKIQKNLKLSEKFAFYPNMEPVDAGQYRFDFTSTLSYGFWQNLTLDLTLDDNYNTEVVSGVQRNEFEARVSLGATF